MKGNIDITGILEHLSRKIQWMIDNTKIPESSQKEWQRLYNNLVEFAHQNEAYIEHLHDDRQAMILKYEYLEEYITKLEAIILFHGITNINMYLARPTEMLMEDAEKAITEGWTQLPGTIYTRVRAEEIEKLLTN
jgi:hypothetical protein